MKVLIVANWKMNPSSLKEAKELFISVQRGIKKIKPFKTEIVICPPFPYLSIFNKSQNSLVKLGAQDCFWEEKGPFTGEVSPLMLKNLGCQYVILGHSERRSYFSETDEQINKKIRAALKAELKPILCIGETEKERKEGKTKEILKKQLKEGLKEIENCKLKIENLTIAYEPVWAISTTKKRKDCLPEEIALSSSFLREFLNKKYGSQLGSKIKILFGGSVNSKNIRNYLEKSNIQGFLVGGASLDAKEFVLTLKQID